VVAYAESTAGDLVREWAEGVGRRVRLATTRAVAGGLTEREYLKAIRDAMGDEGTVARVERIARTEVNRAYQQQRAANDEQLHDAGVDLVKRWVATLDDRVRDTHLAIHGQERELLDLFNVGGHATFDTPPKSSAGHKANGPMDPTLPAEESINCRCDVIYVDRAAAERRYIRKSDR
jgi:SPP1 gp7 family putative phage head morphogenesis protein